MKITHFSVFILLQIIFMTQAEARGGHGGGHAGHSGGTGRFLSSLFGHSSATTKAKSDVNTTESRRGFTGGGAHSHNNCSCDSSNTCKETNGKKYCKTSSGEKRYL